MSLKEAVKKYQSYIPSLVIAVCTWIFSSMGTAVIAAIKDFKHDYGQMKTDIAQNKTDIQSLKETQANHSTLISHAQERELIVESKLQDYKAEMDKRFEGINAVLMIVKNVLHL